MEAFSRGSIIVDYYVVFSELGDVLEGELDFLHEAQAMEKLHAAVRFRPDGRAAEVRGGITCSACRWR